MSEPGLAHGLAQYGQVLPGQCLQFGVVDFRQLPYDIADADIAFLVGPHDDEGVLVAAHEQAAGVSGDVQQVVVASLGEFRVVAVLGGFLRRHGEDVSAGLVELEQRGDLEFLAVLGCPFGFLDFRREVPVVLGVLGGFVGSATGAWRMVFFTSSMFASRIICLLWGNWSVCSRSTLPFVDERVQQV